MTRKGRGWLKRSVSSVLTAAMLLTMIQVPTVAANKMDVYLPENEMEEDILSSDVFYLATASAQLQEGDGVRYLLRLARGGDAAAPAGVTVKISDLTAKYGKDYTISILGSDEKVNNPSDNESLLEMMEGEEYTESELVTEEDYLSQMEEDDELYQATVDAYNDTIQYIETASGVGEAESPSEDDSAAQPEQDGEEPADQPQQGGEEEPADQPEQGGEEEPADQPEQGGEEEPADQPEQGGEEEPADQPQQGGDEESADQPEQGEEEKPAERPEKGEEEDSDEENTGYVDPLQQARSLFTGIQGQPQQVTSTTDTFQQIQDIANVITNAVVGATLTVDFDAGETEKYLVIDVKDNRKGDGTRYFYLMLGEPYGTTTNSAASSCAFTILDDEEQSASVVELGESSYYAEGDTLTVEVVRDGALNTIAEAKLTTESGSAQAGRDFSPVDMSVVFPMGIDKRTIEIPIRTDYFVGEADFSLHLEAVSGCTIGNDSAQVTMTGTAGTTAENGSASLLSVEQSARVSDIELGTPISLANPVKVGSTSYFGGSNYYDSGVPQWVERWEDNFSGWDHFWGAEAEGTTGAGWTLATNHGADIAGVQVDWAKSGSCATIWASFVGSGSRDIPWNYYNGEYVYNSKAKFNDGTKTNMFCTFWDPVRIGIRNHGNCNDCDTLWIHSITPIYRPFVVNLQNADPLKFLNADGTYSTWSDATFLAIAGANNDTNNQVVRYSKEGKNAVTLQQTVGKNVSTPYTYLKSVKMVKDGYTRSIAYYGNDGTSSHTFTMDSNWIDSNRSYIYFEENNVSEAWKNQTGTFGMRGRIELKPEFGYKNVKVKINVPENNFGYFNVSGTNRDLAYSQTFTYHMGDIIKLSTVMREQYKDLYTPAGYMVSYKYNESDTNWVKRDVIVPYSLEDGTSQYLDDNQRLRYGYYEITPLFARNDNAIVVRVREDNLWMCDQSYGIFTTPYVEHTEIDGVRYNDYIVYGDPVYGKIYSLSARPSSQAGSASYNFWTEPGSDKTYTGEVFFHEASNDPQRNVIELTIQYDYYGDFYQEITGSVYRPSYNMTTKQVGYTNMLPAAGAIVNFGTSFAVVDQEGNFKIPLFRSINDHDKSDQPHYIRYTIAYNGEETLQEMRLSHVNQYSREEHTFTVTDKNGAISTQTKSIQVNKLGIGQQLINTENGSIINSIEVYTDAVNQGYNLVLDGDSLTIRARCTSPVKYTQQTVSSDGTLVEIPNALENVTGIEFVIYDAAKNVEIASYPAQKQGEEFVANVSLSQALPGNRLYLRVTTDRSHAVYGSYDENGNLIQIESGDDMNSTTYADVFTGYTFTQKNTEKVPVLQHVDLPITMDFLELPLVGDTGMAFDFPFVSVGSIKTDTGYRMYIGVSAGQIADKVQHTHMTSYAGDTGAYYKDMFSIGHPIQSFKEGLAASYNNIFRDVPKLYDGATSALGAPTWKFDVQIGVYFDFTYMQVTNPNNGAVDTSCIFTGVGGYIGVAAGVKMAWYTILPVVFIPAYFGLEISGNVLGFFGAGTDTSKPNITYDAANNATVDFDDKLGEFNASVQMGATVQVYVGVGLAGTLGLRGGGSLSAMGLWEPSELVSDWGCVLTFKAGIWIDLFLFSVPLQYTLAEMKFGSFEEYNSLSTLAAQAGMNGVDDSLSFSLREPYDDDASVWLPNEPSPMSGFGETSAQTIVANGYEHPEVQLLKLADGSVFMAFLDSDQSRSSLDRAVLKFATYRNGEWSEPVVVQEDGTADFQPSICEMDDSKVMISWLSYDPDTQVTEDAADYLSKLEVYTAVIDPASGTVSEETRLTNDQYYDYTPVSVYDDVTGDRAVYYVKTASSGSAEDMVNSYTNDCVIVYMLYSKDQGRWLFDYYYDNEVASEEDEEILIEKWHGQRFLSSPIPELGLDVPNISDFTAIAYNGIAVYAYTIDQDSSNDTAFDKELFVQFYDFKSHKTYVPVRLTDDNLSDALPQLVRSGTGTDASTKLFWYRDEKEIAYMDLTTLIKEGIDDNGQIKDNYLTGNDGVKRGLDSLYSYVKPGVDNYQGSRSMADFKAVTDGYDIYVVWTQPCTTDAVDEDGNPVQCREVYATALIQEEKEAGSGGAEEDSTDGGMTWADPYRLTYTGAFTDEPAAVIDGEGNMVVLYNQYKQTITENPEYPVVISDFKLRASYMEPCGAVDVTGITYSDETPIPGDTIELNVEVKNNGLTYADGYTVQLYEMKDGAQGALVGSLTSDRKLLPGNTDGYTVSWMVPQDYEGVSIYAVAQEGGMKNVSEHESEPLAKDAVYEISDLTTYQDDEGYRIFYTVTNTGNAVSTAKDVFRVMFSGPYGLAWDYSEAEWELASISMEGIAPGESKTFDEALNVNPEFFDRYGFVDAIAVGMDEEDVYLTDGEELRLMAGKPLALMLNGEEFPETITVRAGETMEFDVTCAPASLNDPLKAAFGTQDTSVAVFEGTTLKALNVGTTTIYGSVSPYGNQIQAITLNVVDESEPLPPSGGDDSGEDDDSSGDKTNTVTTSDGTTITTVTHSDGSTTVTTEAKNGVSSVVETSKNGKVTAQVKVPDAVANEAAAAGETVTIPMPAVPVAPDRGDAASVTVDLPSDTAVKLEIPVEGVTAGTVAVLVGADGVEKVIRTCIVTEKGVVATLSDGNTIKIVDNSKHFVDVPSSYWGFDAVAFATSRELFSGTSATTFSPDDAMTRAMIVTVLASCYDVDTTTGQEWYEAGAQWAVENGVSDGTNLNHAVTREQIATMLWRLAGSPMADESALSGYPDRASISEWAVQAVAWAVSAGIIAGNDTGELLPQSNATRAQVAVMLQRYLENEAGKESA